MLGSIDSMGFILWNTVYMYTPGSSNIAIAGKWTRIEDVFPTKNGDIIYSIAMLVYQTIFTIKINQM